MRRKDRSALTPGTERHRRRGRPGGVTAWHHCDGSRQEWRTGFQSGQRGGRVGAGNRNGHVRRKGTPKRPARLVVGHVPVTSADPTTPSGGQGRLTVFRSIL